MKSTTWNSKDPGGSATLSILENFFAGMPWKEMNHAAGISGRSFRQKTGKLPVTTRILPTLRSGNLKGMAKSLPVMRKI